MDSDIPENEHDLRGVTDRLYGGDQEHRIKQEILAGIGGVRAIRAFTAVEGLPAPEVFHMNEGHAGFLGVERIRELIDRGGLDFDTALTVVRSSTVFTTHTPVPAGIDRFPVEMVERYFGGDDGRTDDDVRAAARRAARPHRRASAPRTTRRSSTWRTWACGWRSAPTACRCCTAGSAGSMFNELWPGFDPDEVPIGSITNGVHAPTWAAPQWLELGRELIGAMTRRASPRCGSGCSRSIPVTCGGSARSCASSSSTTSRAGCACPGWSAVPRKPNWAGSQRLSIRTC